ncbi:secreted LysM effector Lys2-like [Nicotiana sylvestris]|uniref:secreted LysM effector Lys2-like n=1 Tax=Nicotiana sylvestris TaxID=4096 RepID=UPI00388C6823
MAGLSNDAAKKFYLALFLSFLLIAFDVESRKIDITGKSNATLVCNSTYGAEIGDTCFDVAEKFKLTAVEFGALNPNINCDAIFVGQWLCVDGITFVTGKSNATLVCNSTYGAEIGDTCFDVAEKFKLTAVEFGALNPNINCDAIFVGQWLCVDGITFR